MRQENRSLWKPAVWIASCALLLPIAATADAFTVTLDNGNTLTSRYQPKLSMPDETKVMLLTDTGNWVSFPRERVVGVTSKAELSGFGRVINTTTIALGFAPNESDPAADAEAAMDPTTQLLRYLTERDSAGQQDYSVDQFVDTEDAGQGGFPSSYGGSAFGGGGAFGGSAGGFVSPGSVIVPAAPPPAAGDGVQ
jgi:hypothetical protein